MEDILIGTAPREGRRRRERRVREEGRRRKEKDEITMMMTKSHIHFRKTTLAST